MGRSITSNTDDTLESILIKIQTPEDLKGKLGVYLMFMATKALPITEINFYIQIKDPDLWEEIRKACYPTFFEKIKRKIFKDTSTENKSIYNLKNTVYHPLILTYILGIVGMLSCWDCGDYQMGSELFERSFEFIFLGFIYMFPTYYSIKLVQFILNGLFGRKWYWPMGYIYYIIPSFWLLYLLYLHYIVDPSFEEIYF